MIPSRLLALPLLAAGLAPSAIAVGAHAPGPAAQEGGGARVVPAASPEELFARGRELLEAGDADAAAPLLEAADARMGGGLTTRRWVLRAWMEQDRINDALDGIDALARTHEGVEIDYLYGMAFAKKAHLQLRQGVRGASLGMHFDDAVRLLAGVVEAEPERFPDAHHALAVSAWYAPTPDLPLARRAAETAVLVAPDDPRPHHQLGRIAFSQYVAGFTAPQDAERPPAGRVHPHWQRACVAFARVAELLGEPTEPDRARILTDAFVQRARLFAWKRDWRATADCYAQAIGWSPGDPLVDYARIRETLLPRGLFLSALESGAALHAPRAADRPPGETRTLEWWLGYELLAAGRPEEAALAFERSLAAAPPIPNAWYWLARARFELGEQDAAAAALEENWALDPVDLIRSTTGDRVAALAMLDGLLAHVRGTGDDDAALVLAEVRAETALDVQADWRRLGRLFRDRALEEGRPETEASELLERSWAAFVRGLDLGEDDATLVFDAAELLDVHLGRDPERALALYDRAIALAVDALETGDLSRREHERHLSLLEAARRARARLAEREEGGAPAAR
jgi:tetratricopeptide (TPR) repeat protein